MGVIAVQECHLLEKGTNFLLETGDLGPEFLHPDQVDIGFHDFLPKLDMFIGALF